MKNECLPMKGLTEKQALARMKQCARIGVDATVKMRGSRYDVELGRVSSASSRSKKKTVKRKKAPKRKKVAVKKKAPKKAKKKAKKSAPKRVSKKRAKRKARR